ncbi:MAG: transposase [Clostridia bacterium]|nr:transposase [Clostridia bacterium]
MASNRTKYSPEFREEVCRLVIEGNRSATSVAEEFIIDKNTVCSWVRNYRRAHSLPSYAEEQGIMKSVREEESELKRKNKEKDSEIQRLKKENKRLQEDREILKKCMHIFMQQPE